MLDWKLDYYVYDIAMFRKFFLAHIILLILLKSVSAENVDKINLTGNERITKESIIVFGKIDLNDDFDEFLRKPDSEILELLDRIYWN